MDNQHKLIKGYRDLSQGEIDLMNEIKSAGALLESIILKVQEHTKGQFEKAQSEGNEIEHARLAAADPTTWCSQAKHELQTGLMKLTRSVAQPTFF
jgi:hypothetical protein